MKTERRLNLPETVKEHKYFDAFLAFHSKNVNVMRLIVAELEKFRAAKKRSASIKAIIYKIRYDETLRIIGQGEYKINDAFTSIYSRIIWENFPQYRNLLTQKKTKNERRKSARKTPVISK